MGFWLASARDGQDADWIQRFDPRFWTVDFPRPMAAAVVTEGADALRVELAFRREGDLAGLIWASEDRLDHPLLGYRTDRDYARTTLAFRWRSHGVMPLDAVNGPTLTIEGRDAAGVARTWYVRLWNYAVGSGEDARVTLPFSALVAGWSIAGGEAVWPSAIDRLFVSLVAPGYVAGSEAPLAGDGAGWVEWSEIRCEGARAMLEIGDVVVPPHGLGIATAYDDGGTQTPARLVRGLRQLGYRGSVLHYVGMSHFMRLEFSGGAWLVAGAGDPLCAPARAWHAAFLAECGQAGLSPIVSLSFELLARHCPADWQQRAWNGEPARTGWSPPSALLSPASGAAMAWLRSVGAAFARLMAAAGVPVRFQVGEPWWWIMPDRRICLYDAAARAALGGSPVEIADMGAAPDAAQRALLDAAGALLANATAGLVAAVRAAVTQPVEALLLVFTPTVCDPAMPGAVRANLPVQWASPAFDRLQVEDYDWLTAGQRARREAARALIDARLGYPAAGQDYLAGFVPEAGQGALWRAIDDGIDEAIARGGHEVFVWALPQVCRDGFVRLPMIDEGEDGMQAFDEVDFPLALGRDASVIAEFSTTVAATASGFERRNSLWSDARMRFDVGPGVRSEAELGTLLAFFRARRGAARGFRLRDPSDFSSNAMTGTPGSGDQLLGTGDGAVTRFALVKRYGGDAESQVRRITRPVAGTLRVAVGSVERSGGWALEPGGVVAFAAAPGAGAEVRAGFLFDVPVRFAEDRLEIAGHAFAAGEAPSVPVIEVREAA